jgi:hypothetical protein
VPYRSGWTGQTQALLLRKLPASAALSLGHGLLTNENIALNQAAKMSRKARGTSIRPEGESCWNHSNGHVDRGLRNELGSNAFKHEKCRCGKGTVTYVVEMDDWNRARDHTYINCPACKEEDRQKQAITAERAERAATLYVKAKQLALDRYLDLWLSAYSGLQKKDAWKRYIGGSGYPTLGTFYKHVRDLSGLTEYMRWCFLNRFEEALRAMNVHDEEIEAILFQRSQL